MSDKRRQPNIFQRIKKAMELGGLSVQLRFALEHLRRLDLLVFLADRSDGKATSEQELAETFGMGSRVVAYHLKVLQDADLVENVTDDRALGAGKPSYVATARF